MADHISVFGYWQCFRVEKNSPLDYLSADEAQALVDKDLAVWINKNRSIHLLKTKRKYKLRDLSVSPRPWLMDLYVAGDPDAISIIDGRKWRPIVEVIAGEHRIKPVTDMVLRVIQEAIGNDQNDSALSVVA